MPDICLPNRIIIAGRSLAGKDTLANLLVERHGYVKISFATPIYQIAYDLFGMTKKDRKLLQDIGQSLRAIDPDVFVKWAMAEVNKYEKVVISDCRQANERIISVQNGFIPVRITANLEKRIERCRLRDGIEPDISLWELPAETGADNFSYIEIENNGTIEELYENAITKLSRWYEFKL